MSTSSNEMDDAGKGRPIIGIAPDVGEPKPGSVRAVCALTYARAVHAAGGWPVILPPIVELIPLHLERCDGFVLTGGDDPRMEPFGRTTHPKATLVHPLRQAFDTALLSALLERRDVPTLGVCLGMQMMALVAGGDMDQCMPETTATAGMHRGDARHGIRWEAGATSDSGVASRGLASGGPVTSHHSQAVTDAGRMRVVARAEDGVIEAIDLPGAPFLLGVQWHPERTEDPGLGVGVFRALVEAARSFRDAPGTRRRP